MTPSSLSTPVKYAFTVTTAPEASTFSSGFMWIYCIIHLSVASDMVHSEAEWQLQQSWESGVAFI